MAKKKELPKAMMGKIIKPVVRAVVSTGKVAGKSTVRGGKAYYNAVEHAPAIKGPVSFVKAGGKGIKAAGKGFARGVKSEIKVEKAKAAERVAAEKAKATKAKVAKTPPISEEKRLMDELNAQKANTQKVNKTTSGKKSMTPEQKKKLKKVAIGTGIAAGVGTYKYVTRKRRTLND